jgi:hypothetical protein
MTRTVILVPRRDGIADRDALWAFCRPWWESQHPDWPVIEGHHDDGLFNRSAAINRAAEAAGDWDVAVIIDSDVICDPERVRTAVTLAETTGRMVIPHDIRRDLSRHGTAAVMRGWQGDWSRQVRKVYPDMVSAVIVVPRPLWDAVSGFDETFCGWGFEDNAFAESCLTFGGAIERIPGELWHLYHRSAPEGKRGHPANTANRARAARYTAARGDKDATRALRASPVNFDPSPAGIPRILHRVVPEQTSDVIEGYWRGWGDLHPGWELRTWRDPIDPGAFPLTSPHWGSVACGAQLADLVRLEVLWHFGGVYVDSDVEPYRPLDPLLPLSAFAAWEDDKHVPNAVIGAAPHHPAIRDCITLAIEAMPQGVWEAGVGVTSAVLPWRPDVLLLPPGSFYPYHYSRARRERGVDHSTSQPWAFAAHHWAGSWLPEGKRW